MFQNLSNEKLYFSKSFFKIDIVAEIRTVAVDLKNIAIILQISYNTRT